MGWSLDPLARAARKENEGDLLPDRCRKCVDLVFYLYFVKASSITQLLFMERVTIVSMPEQFPATSLYINEKLRIVIFAFFKFIYVLLPII